MRHRSPQQRRKPLYSVSVEPSKSNTLEPVSEPRLARHEAITIVTRPLRRDVVLGPLDVV